jgi:hypothetical protein
VFQSNEKLGDDFNENEFGSNYASITDVNFTAKYRASCYCDAVQYEVCSDPALFNFGGVSKVQLMLCNQYFQETGVQET